VIDLDANNKTCGLSHITIAFDRQFANLAGESFTNFAKRSVVVASMLKQCKNVLQSKVLNEINQFQYQHRQEVSSKYYKIMVHPSIHGAPLPPKNVQSGQEMKIHTFDFVIQACWVQQETLKKVHNYTTLAIKCHQKLS